MSIIISRPGADTIRLEPRGIPRETMLQEYMQQHPEVLPMNELREDIRMLVLAREFGTKSGSIDVLALDQEGNIYIIETKLYKNPDKRQVVAQALDYGASLWRQYATGSEFMGDLRESFRSIGGWDSLEEGLAEVFGADEEIAQEILESVRKNLEEGSFHFIVLMDRMDDRLKDLIAFVNENSRFSVYGVELDFYEYEDLEIVIPRMYGAEVKKEVATSQRRTRIWNQDLFFQDAKTKLPDDQVDALRKLYEYCKDSADTVDWGSGVKYGSFNVKYSIFSETKSIITARSNGRLSVNFGWLEDDESSDRFVLDFAKRLESEVGLELRPNYSDQFPHFAPESWTPNVENLVAAIEKSLDAISENS
jgi:hypothetical protein